MEHLNKQQMEQLQLMKHMGKLIQQSLDQIYNNQKTGFFLSVFDPDSPNGANIVITNSEPETTIQALQEALKQLSQVRKLSRTVGNA